jgi:hypothetical protein
LAVRLPINERFAKGGYELTVIGTKGRQKGLFGYLLAVRLSMDSMTKHYDEKLFQFYEVMQLTIAYNW